MKALVQKFVRDERGLETVEYAIMTALIVIALIVAIKLLSGAVAGAFNDTANTVNAR